jgi:Lrp/AsnC family transcriptional regulator, leucine-responsive regulatory protein
MDEFDRKLLSLIQEDCKLPYAELGSRIGLSLSAVNERLKKMQAQGIIRGCVAVLNPNSIGLDICAFIQVSIDRPENEPPFLKRIAKLPEVQECHHITGDFSYLLKVRVRNTSQLETLLKEKIKTLKGLVRTHSLIVLSTTKETTALKIEESQERKGAEDE